MMRILLLGDASNCHRALAEGLRRVGHDVTVMSAGSGWMRTERDIDISRRPGLLGGIRLAGRLLTSLHSELRDYDVVSIHNPGFLHLRPQLTQYFFDRLMGENRSVFLTALGTDAAYIDMCADPASPIKYNEWRLADRPGPLMLRRPELWRQWHNTALRRLHEHVYERIDGAVSVLYEYHVAMSRVLPPEMTAYGGIPIDTRSLAPVVIPENPGKVRLFLGRHAGREAEKGTDLLEQAARAAIARRPGRAELVVVENRPYAEYISLLRSAHVVLDQAYSYTPATNALLAMAQGLNAVSGGEEDYYRFIGEAEMRPIINASPDLGSLTDTLEAVITSPEKIAERGRESRQFVMKHNDTDVVAARFLDFWQQRLKATGK